MMPNPDLETLPRADLERLQLERLRLAAERLTDRVPFYREAFDQRGLQASGIRSLDDLSHLPFTTKADLRARWPFGMLAVPREDLVELHASSGTTGPATLAAYTRTDLDTWGEVMARTLALGGLRPGDLAHNAYGYGLFTGGLGFHYGALKLGVAVVPVSSGNTARQIKLLEEFGSSALFATPSYALHLAEALEEAGVGLDRLRLRHGHFGAEPWSEAMRREIERRLGIKAVDCYGLSEIVGPGVAAECQEAQDGLHLAEDHFLVEVLDPATQQPVAPGQPGELVITTLTREAVPVLRYRTGDISAIKSGDCACGRTTRRIARLSGRIDDMLIVRGINLFPSEVEAVLLRLPELEPQYRLVVDRRRALDVLEVEVEPRQPLPDGPRTAALAEQVARLLRDEMGISVMVRVLAPRTIPRSEGKALRVVDRRQL